MYVLFLFLMVEGGGLLRDEVQALVLLQRSRFLEDLAILDNINNTVTDYCTWKMTEWNYPKKIYLLIYVLPIG